MSYPTCARKPARWPSRHRLPRRTPTTEVDHEDQGDRPLQAGRDPRLVCERLVSSLAAPIAVKRRGTELTLVLFAVVLTLVAFTSVSAAYTDALPSGLLEDGLGFAALALAAHFAVRRLAPYADPVLLPAAIALNGLGLVLIHRLGPRLHHPRARRRSVGRPGRRAAAAGLDRDRHHRLRRGARRRARPSPAAVADLHRDGGRPRSARAAGAAAGQPQHGQRRPDLGPFRRLLLPAGRARQARARDLLRRLPGPKARRPRTRRAPLPRVDVAARP